MVDLDDQLILPIDTATLGGYLEGDSLKADPHGMAIDGKLTGWPSITTFVGQES
jgi:hypothetical protein